MAGLVDVGFDRHVRINKSQTFAKGRAHVNGIEAFWSFTKRRLAKFNGVKKLFRLHLKECEWRYCQSLPSSPPHRNERPPEPWPKPQQKRTDRKMVAPIKADRRKEE